MPQSMHNKCQTRYITKCVSKVSATEAEVSDFHTSEQFNGLFESVICNFIHFTVHCPLIGIGVVFQMWCLG